MYNNRGKNITLQIVAIICLTLIILHTEAVISDHYFNQNICKNSISTDIIKKYKTAKIIEKCEGTKLQYNLESNENSEGVTLVPSFYDTYNFELLLEEDNQFISCKNINKSIYDRYELGDYIDIMVYIDSNTKEIFNVGDILPYTIELNL